MTPYVQIAFQCLPLRCVGRLDVPLDASPRHRAKCERLKQAIEVHTADLDKTYYLYDAHAVFHLANSEVTGMLRFEFEGTLITDASDRRTERVELEVQLASQTCDWLSDLVVPWWQETVRRAVAIEFNRYIAAGQLAQEVQRRQQASDEGQIGMYL